jgi:hypothetical protein
MPRQLSRQLYVSQQATQAYLWALPSINTLNATRDELICEIQGGVRPLAVYKHAPRISGQPHAAMYEKMPRTTWKFQSEDQPDVGL